MKTKDTTLTEQYQISKSQKEAKSIPVAHKYMTGHVLGLEQAL